MRKVLKRMLRVFGAQGSGMCKCGVPQQVRILDAHVWKGTAEDLPQDCTWIVSRNYHCELGRQRINMQLAKWLSEDSASLPFPS